MTFTSSKRGLTSQTSLCDVIVTVKKRKEIIIYYNLDTKTCMEILAAISAPPWHVNSGERNKIECRAFNLDKIFLAKA